MANQITRNSNSQEIINIIVLAILRHETKRHQECIDYFVRANSLGSGSFIHRAQTFRPSWALGATGVPRTELTAALWPEMDLFLLDKDSVDKDAKNFWQVLFSLINPCASVQDVRDALPEFVAELFPELIKLPRQQPEQFTITDARVQRQFAKQREKMELHCMVKKNPQLPVLMNLYHFSL